MDQDKLIKLNQWTLDPVNRTLSSEDKTEILEAKYVSLLVFLAEKSNQVVTREQLIETVWQQRFVDYKTINSAISRIRKILGGDTEDYIKTHPKRGYSLNCKLSYQPRAMAQSHCLAPESSAEKTTLYTPYLILAAIVFFSVTGYLLAQLKTPENPQPQQKVNVTPLTYMQGAEFSAAMSHDGSLLAFVHQKDDQAPWQVMVKDLSTNQSKAVDTKTITASPYWSAQSNTLYYQASSQGQCVIKKVKVDLMLELSAAKEVAACGGMFSLRKFTNIAVSSDDNWLYYIYGESDAIAPVIKRFHLKNHQEERLTSPSLTLAGDFNLSLSPDNSQLAFLRKESDLLMKIMVLDLTSGELTSITELPYQPYGFTWSASGSHLVYTDDISNQVIALNINSKQSTALYQHSEQLIEPVRVDGNRFLLSFGSTISANIKQIDLSTPKPSVSSLISSGFDDHSATVYDKEKTKIAFVSNRSGSHQIWLQDDVRLQQLSHFQGHVNIQDLSFSADGESLLFLKDKNLQLLNLSNRELVAIKHPTKIVKSIRWQCQSNENILIIGADNGSWGLYQVNIQTQKSQLLSSGITSIHGHCQEGQASRYYASALMKKGLYQLTPDWTINPAAHYLINKVFSDSRSWAVSESALYYMSQDNEITQFDFKTRQNKVISLTDINTYYLSIANNRLLINDVKLADTFIAEITLEGIK